MVVLLLKLGRIVFNNWDPATFVEYHRRFISEDIEAFISSTLLRWSLVIAAAVYLAIKCAKTRYAQVAIAAAPIVLFFAYRLVACIYRHQALSTVYSGSRTGRAMGPELAFVGNQLWLVLSLMWKDIAFLSAFSIFVCAVVIYTPSKFWPAAKFGLSVLVALMFTMAGLELAAFIETGVTGSGELLRYFLVSASHGGTTWWEMLASHTNVTTVAAILAPFLIAAAFNAIYRPTPASRPPHAGPRPGVVLVVSAIAIGTFAWTPAITDMRYHKAADDTFLALKDFLPTSESRSLAVMQAVKQAPPLFQTTNAMAYPIDSLPQQRRNVLLIMLESAQAKSTSMYSPGKPTTPFLQNLSQRGAIAQDMYAVIPRTGAAWVGIFYGLYPSTNELLFKWPLQPDGQPRFRSLPQLLDDQGYATGFITTSHSDFEQENTLVRGFGFQSIQNGYTLPHGNLQPVSYNGYEDHIMMQPALEWMSQQAVAQRPFLMAMMTNVGHDPFSFPASWKRIEYRTGNRKYDDYLNCLAYIDSELRDLFNGLEQRGILKSTVVVILGDHGEAFGSHGERQRILSSYDEALKIPLIVYADGIVKPGSVITGLRQEQDILPTVLDLLNLRSEGFTAPGVSLLRPVPEDRQLYYSTSFDHSSLALRQGPLKYIYNFDHSPMEVYNIPKDPAEEHDISASISEAAKSKTAFDLQVWQERVRRDLFTEDKPIANRRATAAANSGVRASEAKGRD